jgi:hypothetical protein
MVQAVPTDRRERTWCAEPSPVARRADALIEQAGSREPRGNRQKDSPGHIP